MNIKFKLIPVIDEVHGVFLVNMYYWDYVMNEFITPPITLDNKHLYGLSVSIRQCLRAGKLVIVEYKRGKMTAYQPDVEVPDGSNT